MRVTAVEMRDFRTYARASAQLGAGLTVVHGPNGAGKSNLLEAVYFGCTGRSCRTTNEREVVRFGAGAAASGADQLEGEERIAAALAKGGLGIDLRRPVAEQRLHLDGTQRRQVKLGDGAVAEE